MSKKTLIWDWNGTLLNDTDLCVSSINELLKRRNLPLLDKERYREVFSFPVQEYYKTIGFDFSSEDFSVPAKEFTDLYNSKVEMCSLHHRAVDILEYFKSLGYSQFVLSAMKQDMLVKTLGDQNILPYFKDVAGLNDHFAVSKLQRGIELMEYYMLDRDNTVMVGDTLHDAEVASSLGIPCVLIASGHQSEERLRTNGVPVIRKLETLKELI